MWKTKDSKKARDMISSMSKIIEKNARELRKIDLREIERYEKGVLFEKQTLIYDDEERLEKDLTVYFKVNKWRILKMVWKALSVWPFEPIYIEKSSPNHFILRARGGGIIDEKDL